VRTSDLTNGSAQVSFLNLSEDQARGLLVDVVNTESLKDLSLDDVTDTRFGHDLRVD